MRRQLSRAVSKLARLFGAELIPASRNGLDSELVWARNMQRLGGPPDLRLLDLSRPVEFAHLRWLLALHRIETVVDVGANRGQFAARMREAGFAEQLHCFEPQPHLLDSLRQTLTPPFSTHACALGSAKAVLQLDCHADDSFASLHRASPLGRDAFPSEFESRGGISVPVRTLEDVWPELGSPDPERTLLKSDTQGHDLEVLRGAGDLLERVSVVVTEAPILPLYEDAADFAAICAYLAARGLHLSGTYPVSFDKKTGCLLELNAWFVRVPPRK